MLTPGVSVILLLAACGGPVGIVRGDLQAETGLGPSPERAAISGRVLDDRGNGVGGAHLLTDPRGFEAQTDAKGEFSFPWLPSGVFSVVAAAPGWEPIHSEAVVLEAGDRAELALVLSEALPSARLTVTVTGPTGEPVSDAVVMVSDGSLGSSDADGVVVLDGVVGEDLVLEVADASGDLHARTLSGERIAGGGGLQWSPQLSGRPDGEVGYFGDGWCALCHAELVEAFAATPHGRAFMVDVDGAFAAALDTGLVLALGGGEISLWQDGAEVVAMLVDSEGVLLELPVIGLLGDSDSQAVPLVALGDQRYPLPVAWAAASEARADHPCSQARLVPFEPERWLDESGRLAFSGDAPDASASAERACLPCHVSGFALAEREDGGVDMSFEEAEGWQDDGVSCERCHGPGESHLYSMSPLDVVQPGLLDTARANEVCAQCHSRTEGLHSGLPHPFGEERPFQPGEVLADTTASASESWSSGAAAAGHMQADELLDAAHGPTGANLRCVDCHEVHGEQGRHGLLRAELHDNALCEGCHWDHSFDGDAWMVAEHMGHRFYDPSGAQEAGRCSHCHMPATASDAAWCAETGSGSLSSHRFESLSPQHTVDVFHDRGVEELEAGQAPPHACGDCHAWNAFYFESLGLSFRGPQGDPALLSTHEAYLQAAEGLVP